MRIDTPTGYVVSYPTPTGYAAAQYKDLGESKKWVTCVRRRYFKTPEEAVAAMQRWSKK